MSLMSELEDLGELMADNLVTMGVTDATASDGLTTLANAILDIQGGSTPKLVLVKENKFIISYTDSETLKLYAILFGDNVSNQTITFYANNTQLGTATTDSNGVAVYEYVASKNGETTFYATNNTLTSNTANVEDIWYWNDGTNFKGVSIANGITCSVDDGSIKITTTTTGEKYVTYPPTFTNSDNFIIEIELGKLGTSQYIAFWLNNATTANGLWCAYESGHFSGGFRGSSITQYTTTFVVGDKFKVKQLNGTISLYKNDELIYSKTTSFSASTYHFGFYTNNSRVQYLKNISVRSL